MRLSLYFMLSVRAEILKIQLDSNLPWGIDLLGTVQEAEAEARELGKSNNEVDYVIDQLTADEQVLIKLKYFQRRSKEVEVMKQLSLSQSSYYRLRNRAILSSAKAFGYYPD